MKLNTSFLLLAFLAVILSSCGSSKPREVVVDNKFKMDIPEYMKSTTLLNDYASLQYHNPLRELYVIVIDDIPADVDERIIDEGLEEEYSTGFDGYCRLIMDTEDYEFLNPDDWDAMKEETINGLFARTYEDTRFMIDNNIYYKIALIKGEETYYQLIAWTLGNRKEKYKQVIHDMVASFAER